MAPVPPALLDEIHHTVRQRYRQAVAAAAEKVDEAEALNPAPGIVGGFVSAGRHERKDDEHRPVFIKPTARPGGQPQERKSMLGLDKLAAAKRAENMMKQLGDAEGAAVGESGDWEAGNGDGERGTKKSVAVSLVGVKTVFQALLVGTVADAYDLGLTSALDAGTVLPVQAGAGYALAPWRGEPGEAEGAGRSRQGQATAGVGGGGGRR